MRKASKKRIATALNEFDVWYSAISPRITALSVPGASSALKSWANDARIRIESGDIGNCTQALISSVIRTLKWAEAGYYSRVENGAWTIA